jgi:uracil-DNA glycosylase family 4
MRKPDSCLGCPFYGDGQGFVPDEIVEGAPVLVVMQNPGAEEEAAGKPAVGATGQFQQRHFFPPAGLVRGQTSIANAYRCRHKHTNELPELNSQVARQALTHCTNAHFKLPEGVKLIVAQGAYALYMLTGEGLGDNRTVSSWRGYALKYNPMPRPLWSPPTDIWTPGPNDIPVLATLHVASLFQDMKMYPALQHDWSKVPLMLSRKWPLPLPTILGPQDVDLWPGTLAFDTEYDPTTRQLHRFSVSGCLLRDEPKVWVIEASEAHMVPDFRYVTKAITQNALADLPYWRQFGGNPSVIEDEMLAHSVLWSDLPHDLEFLGSLYGYTNRWKHLMHGNPRVYSAADAYNELAVWLALEKQLKHDEASRYIYYQSVLPLVPIIEKAEKPGQRVHQERTKVIATALKRRTEAARLKAQAVCGWPINVGSTDQVRHELYTVLNGGKE